MNAQETRVALARGHRWFPRTDAPHNAVRRIGLRPSDATSVIRTGSSVFVVVVREDRVLVTTQMDCGESVPLVSFRSVQVALGAGEEKNMVRTGKIARLTCFTIVVMGLVFGGLLAPSGAAAYRGEFTTWQSMKSDFSAFLLVSAFDTGDVYSNTEVVNLVDAAFVRDSLGSQYKNVRSMGNIAPVPGTTVVRMFTFTLKGDNGTLVVTDEYGSNVWFFMFSTTKVSGSEMESFVSGTVLAQIPTNLPTGYGEAKLKQ